MEQLRALHGQSEYSVLVDLVFAGQDEMMVYLHNRQCLELERVRTDERLLLKEIIETVKGELDCCRSPNIYWAEAMQHMLDLFEQKVRQHDG